jgi:LysM repeat protein
VLPAQQVPKGGVSPIAELIEAGDPVAGPVIPDLIIDSKPEAFPETHTIRSGDNPWTIAKHYGISMQDLLSLNEIKNTKNLQIGQVLKLPERKLPVAHQPIGSAIDVDPVFDPEGHEVYVVQKGDNPWTIAKKLKINYQQLVDLNRDLDPKDLKIGQHLKLPKKEVVGSDDPVKKNEKPAFDADGHDVYVIKKGDNPWTVAKRLKIDYEALINLNRIADPRDLKIGQKLKLPKDGEMITSFPGALEGEAPKTPFDADGHDVYVIKPGDNPWTVAKRLKINYNELIAINQISNPKDLKIGQKLKLPKNR